jgi:hypothetical protein
MTSVIYLILLNFNEKIYLYILSELFAFLVCESSDLRLGFRFFSLIWFFSHMCSPFLPCLISVQLVSAPGLVCAGRTPKLVPARSRCQIRWLLVVLRSTRQSS